MTDIEARVQRMLLPVFGLSSTEQIRPEHSLVRDLNAESLDFVQIIYLVEKEFGVVIRPDEILSGAAAADPALLFNEGRLTEEGATVLNAQFPERATPFAPGMLKRDIYEAITVHDLARAIHVRMERSPRHA